MVLYIYVNAVGIRIQNKKITNTGWGIYPNDDKSMKSVEFIIFFEEDDVFLRLLSG